MARALKCHAQVKSANIEKETRGGTCFLQSAHAHFRHYALPPFSTLQESVFTLLRFGIKKRKRAYLYFHVHTYAGGCGRVLKTAATHHASGVSSAACYSEMNMKFGSAAAVREREREREMKHCVMQSAAGEGISFLLVIK